MQVRLLGRESMQVRLLGRESMQVRLLGRESVVGYLLAPQSVHHGVIDRVALDATRKISVEALACPAAPR